MNLSFRPAKESKRLVGAELNPFLLRFFLDLFPPWMTLLFTEGCLKPVILSYIVFVSNCVSGSFGGIKRGKLAQKFTKGAFLLQPLEKIILKAKVL